MGEYRRKRDAARTPEPVPAEGAAARLPVGPGVPAGEDDVFVVHEHHARSLHWDVRFERGGVLVSWAVPKGLPADPGPVRLAVHTEDHPLEYAAFSGVIPRGEYGAGRMEVWDRGRYEVLKWTPEKIDVVLHGSRVEGRYVFIRHGEQTSDWLVRRVDPPVDAAWQSMPVEVRPMLAVAGSLPLPGADAEWAFEFKWDGIRALVAVDGGRVRVSSRSGRDVTEGYPELRALGEQLGGVSALLDGEIVVFDEGRPSFSLLQRRLQLSGAARVQRAAREHPVTFLVFDLLYLDGRSCLPLPYADRRRLLEGVALRGPSWQTPPSFTGDGESVVRASREQALEGVVAKRRASPYQPGRRSADWVKISDLRTQEVVIGGWAPGAGNREGVLGGLLLGIPEGAGLRYVGRVGTGFSAAVLRELTARLRRLARSASPFVTSVPMDRARGVEWVEPTLVGEVVFQEWTRDGRLRAPRWRGLRPDREPSDVVVAEVSASEVPGAEC